MWHTIFHNIFSFGKLRVDFTPLPTIPYLVLCASENDSLTLPLTMDDVFKAVMNFHPLKAPWPDGLNPIFFQKF